MILITMVYDTMVLSPIALWFMILITMVYDAYKYTIHGLCKPTNVTGRQANVLNLSFIDEDSTSGWVS